MKLPIHGSNPRYLYESLDVPMPANVLDFSVNLNPLGQPEALSSFPEPWEMITSDYPDPLHTEFRRKLSIQENISADSILVGNGAAEIIHMIACWQQGKKVAIVEPAFSEYESSCKTFSCSIKHVELSSQPVLEDFQHAVEWADALFLCNPGNPLGTVLDDELVKDLIDLALHKSCLLIVDEAFQDFLPNGETCKELLSTYPNLIILRSMTKMFSVAGIRLGYGLMHPDIKGFVQQFQPHWSVNSIALKTGEICLDQHDFVLRTRAFIGNERKRVFSFLRDNGFSFYPSLVNFYCMKDDSLKDQLDLILFLMKNGLVPRHTYNFRGLEGKWLRLAVKDKASNDFLMEVLQKWRRK